MLITILIWVILFFLFASLGSGIISCVGFKKNLFGVNYFIVVQWLGMLFMSTLMLVFSLCTAVDYKILFYILVSSLVFSMSSRSRRKLLYYSIKVPVTSSCIVPGLVLILVCALYSSQLIFWGDSGAYHFTIIKWMSDFGLVPGLALFRDQMGFNSSWFSITAALNHGWLEGKVGGIMGGYVFLLALMQWGISFDRFRIGLEDYADIFTIYGYAILTPLVLRWGIVISPSPDVPIMMIGIFFSSIILREKGVLKRNSMWLLLIMAALAFNIKLSSLPLLAVMYFIAIHQLSLREKFLASLVTCVLISPVLIANTLTSGYPLYPSSAISFNVDWLSNRDRVVELSKTIYNFALYGPDIWHNAALYPIGFIDTIFRWGTSRQEFCTALLIVANIGSLCWLLKQKRQEFSIFKWPLAIGILGVTFFLLTAPTLRFGISWLAIIPSLLLSFFGTRLIRAPLQILGFIKFSILTSTSLMLIIFLSPNPFQKILYGERFVNDDMRYWTTPRINFFVPSGLYPHSYISNGTKVVGVVPILEVPNNSAGTFYYINLDSCWNLPIPCGDGRKLEVIDPKRGLPSGFRKIN